MAEENPNKKIHGIKNVVNRFPKTVTGCYRQGTAVKAFCLTP